MPSYERDSLQKLIESLKAAKNRPQQQSTKQEQANAGEGKPKEQSKSAQKIEPLPLYKPPEKP
jgi:hypothetical protein